MRWFSSDHHFGHRNIIEFCGRPWNDVDSMNRGLIENHNALVHPDDEVYFLGDIVWNDRFVDVLGELNGDIMVVPGNHDSVHRMHKKWKKFLPAWEQYVTVLPGQVIIMMGGKPVLLCHFPYAYAETPLRAPLTASGKPDRYSGLRPRQDDLWLLCGHVHGAWLTRDRQINVGVDVHSYNPVPEGWILELIEQEEARLRTHSE